MNNETHSAQHSAWERGYNEALLDVYCFLTGNEQVLDIDPAHYQRLQAMFAQANAGNSRIVDITDLPALV